MRVAKPGDLGGALQAAIASNKPYVVEVDINRDVHPIGTGSWQFVPYPAPKPNFVPVK